MLNISNARSGTIPIERLFVSQKAAKDAFITHLFPCYTEKNIWNTSFYLLNNTFQVISVIKNKTVETIHLISIRILKIGNFLSKGMIFAIVNTVYPINILNGERHFVGAPRSLEKSLSDFIIYPFSVHDLSKSNKRLKKTEEKIEDLSRSISLEIISNNKDILNPPELTQFNYTTQSVDMNTSTAFPGGNILISTDLIKKIDRSINYQEIESCCIEFEEGSKAIIDLRGIELNDVLAFHIASLFSYPASSTWLHHSIETFIRSCFLSLADPIESLINMFSERKSTYLTDIAGSFMGTRAQFNPLGALYFMQFLQNQKLDGTQRNYKISEIFYQTPSEKNRLRALFVAIAHFAPESLKGKVNWEFSSHGYDLTRASPAIETPLKVKQELERGFL